MRTALKKLSQHGVQALRPQKVNDKWRNPAVSARVAADLRKKAIRSGTYGFFDRETGIGWDPLWDAPILVPSDNNNAIGADLNDATRQHHQQQHPMQSEQNRQILAASNPGKISSIRPPKESKRQRTRESRAQKIEALLATADDKIEEHRLELESKKPPKGIETEFKLAMAKSKNK
mmetsp:Transcript_2709/g.6212  ORF Transcript_2709/g.6212 Transcript_2709/m.6212 type:complete len:176 (-) Transcript_2709:377-904(-)